MATQQAPWASGRHKPGQRRKAPKTAYGKVWDNTKRSYMRATRKHPWINLLLQIVLGIVAVVALVLGSVMQSVLWYLVIGLSGLGQLAIKRAQQMERDRQGAQPRPRPTTAGPRTPPPPPSASSNPKPAAGPVKCTQTGKPIEGDAKCTCASRHIATEQGRQRYGGNIGDPIGKRTKPGKATS